MTPEIRNQSRCYPRLSLTKALGILNRLLWRKERRRRKKKNLLLLEEKEERKKVGKGHKAGGGKEYL